MNIRIKKLTGTAKIPTRGSEQAAGYDIYADGQEGTAWSITPGTKRMIGTGIAIEIPEGYFGGIYPRSGLSTKKGLRLCNCVAVIDSDYRGEIHVPLYNDSDVTQIVEAGERIAQIIFEPYQRVHFNETDHLDPTERGEGGFGSTGSKYIN